MNVSEPAERLSDDDLAAILEQTVQLAITPTAFLTMLTYAVLSVSHLVVLRGFAAVVMAVLAFGSSITACWVWRLNLSKTTWKLRSHDVLGILAAVVLCNVTTHMVLLEDHLQTTSFAISLLGFGFLMLDRTWFLVTITITLATWATIFHSLPSAENSYHFEYMIAISSAIAIATHIARYRTTVHVETARLLGERRREHMEVKLRQQHDQLAHASRLITMGELVASFAHELNQPLTAISNYAVAGKMQLAGTATDEVMLADQLQQISDTAVRAGQIIKRLRGLAVKSSTVRPGIDLNQVVHDAAALMANSIRQNGVELRLDLADDLPKVQADEIQMQQVIINLMQNGIDSLRDRSEPAFIFLQSSVTSDGPKITVQDNGPGIQIELPHSVFDAFSTTKADGMGMGLAICRSIVENHGGRIWCHNGGGEESKPTEFHFSIPSMLE